MGEPGIKISDENSKMNNEEREFWAKMLGPDYYIDKNGETQRRPQVILMDNKPTAYYEDDTYNGDGIEDIPFALKASITLFLTFCFFLGIFLLPVKNAPNAEIIIKEKTTTVVDSVSAFDVNQEKDLMTQIMDEKKQQIAEVNEEIKKMQEKKAFADTLKANKREILTMTAFVDDGNTSREIKAEAEVDSVTDEAIDMLSKSLQTTVDSIAMQMKIKNFIAIQKAEGNTDIVNRMLSLQGQRKTLTGLLGI